MATAFWLKLWIDLLDDAKTARMPDWLFRRWIYLLLAAKEYDQDGLLPPVQDLAWRLRLSEEQVDQALRALATIGVVCEVSPGSWMIVNFKKRQAPSESIDRMRAYRERKKQKKEQQLQDTSYAVTRNVSSTSPLLSSDSISDSCSLIFKLYEQEIGLITPLIADQLSEAEKDYPAEWFAPAFQEAARNNVRTWSYASAILKRWKIEGFQSQKKPGSNGKQPKTTGAIARARARLEAEDA